MLKFLFVPAFVIYLCVRWYTRNPTLKRKAFPWFVYFTVGLLLLTTPWRPFETTSGRLINGARLVALAVCVGFWLRDIFITLTGVRRESPPPPQRPAGVWGKVRAMRKPR